MVGVPGGGGGGGVWVKTPPLLGLKNFSYFRRELAKSKIQKIFIYLFTFFVC